jgi:hypothetical protein
MDKKLKWVQPTLIELGNARRMSFGKPIALCHVGTGATACDFGQLVGT